MDRESLYNYVITEINNVPVDTDFLIADLFKGYIWKSIPKADRLWLGREFLNNVKENQISGVQVESKTTSHKQIYKRIEELA